MVIKRGKCCMAAIKRYTGPSGSLIPKLIVFKFDKVLRPAMRDIRDITFFMITYDGFNHLTEPEN
jgi:hypothetical protein